MGLTSNKTISKIILALCVAIPVITLLMPQASNTTNDEKQITVLAAAGLTNAITAIADEYEEAANTKVILNFDSSSRLAKQLEAGADADIYISANEKWMDYVCDNNFADIASRCDLATTDLILIGTKDIYQNNNIAFDSNFAALYSGHLAIGDFSNVPVGMYTEQALKKTELWSPLEDNFVLASKVSDVVRYVETGECELGICYAASAIASDNVVKLYTFAADTHDPIKFISAKCTNAKPEAENFLAFLSENKSLGIFAANGFTTSTRLETLKYTKHKTLFTQEELQAVILSVKVALVCVGAVLVPGIFLGWLLARKNFHGKDFFEAFVNLPLVIPPVVTGYLALLLLGKNGLLGKYIYDTFGFSIAFTWKAAVVTSAIMGMPLLIRSVKTAMTMTDIRLEKAALTLGSSPAKVFFTITLPLAMPGILSGVMLAFARSLGEFGATATFAGNIPGKTQTLSLAIHNLTQTPGGDAAALRLTLISIIISIVALIGSEIIVRRAKVVKGVVCNA